MLQEAATAEERASHVAIEESAPLTTEDAADDTIQAQRDQDADDDTIQAQHVPDQHCEREDGKS